MTKPETKEPQYSVCLEHQERMGRTEFGLMSGYCWDTDPKRLTFVLPRYKFVAKMLPVWARSWRWAAPTPSAPGWSCEADAH